MRSKPAFTLIEVMVVVVIMGMLAAIIMPTFRAKPPRYEREKFVARLNAQVQAAWQHAIVTQTLHKVIFDIKKRQVHVEYALPRIGKKDLQFEPLREWYGVEPYIWDERFVIKQFRIEGFDEMARSERETIDVFFYVVPDGLTQEVTINFVDTKDLIGRKPRQFGLVLNPFAARFSVYDGFQK